MGRRSFGGRVPVILGGIARLARRLVCENDCGSWAMDGKRGGARRHPQAYGVKKSLTISRKVHPGGEHWWRDRRLLECIQGLADTGLDSGEITFGQNDPQLLRRAPLRCVAAGSAVIAAESPVLPAALHRAAYPAVGPTRDRSRA